MHQIVKDFNITLIEIIPNDEYCKANGIETYLNKSWLIGNNTIQLGIYDDEELKLISLFHEIGHTQDKSNKDNLTIFQIEKQAWEIGYQIAEKYNIYFSNNAKNWALEQLNTYKHI